MNDHFCFRFNTFIYLFCSTYFQFETNIKKISQHKITKRMQKIQKLKLFRLNEGRAQNEPVNSSMISVRLTILLITISKQHSWVSVSVVCKSYSTNVCTACCCYCWLFFLFSFVVQCVAGINTWFACWLWLLVSLAHISIECFCVCGCVCVRFV